MIVELELVIGQQAFTVRTALLIVLVLVLDFSASA